MIAVVAKEAPSASVTDIFHAVRRRCPEWAVTPHRVRKALAALQSSQAKKKSGKQSGSGARGSADGLARAFPHDIVELRPHATRTRHAQWQWRGQVLRVAGYDDGETTDDETQELPPGHCSVFWLGHGLEQWPNALTKESSIRVIDRPWVLGDRVARADDPRSLGTVVGVQCSLRLSGVPGPTAPSPEVPVQAVRAVGGFRAEDWVACEAARWVGKVEEAVFRVEVELCGKGESRLSRGRGRRKAPVCVFQVSSEGLQGLEPASGEDVTPQELSPHFPGQRVRAPARLWRQAEWICGGLGRRSPRRGAALCGVVTSVECCLLAVRWLAGAVRDSPPPDEWVVPEALRPLTVPNSSEGWAVGDHVQAGLDWHPVSAVVVESRSVIDVRWSDGTLEEGVPSLRLCPRPHISAHDFLPHDFVGRSGEGLADVGGLAAPPSAGPTAAAPGAGTADAMNTEADEGYGEDAGSNGDLNHDSEMYGYGVEEDAAARAAEILPTEGLIAPQVDTPLGVVKSVDLQARTAVVQWVLPVGSGGAGETEEVSVFELTDHPQVDVRLGDAVLLPDAQELRWAGRVCGLRADGQARVELLDGTSGWHDVRRLVMVDDGEGSESGDEGMGSEMGSTRSDAALSEISEGHEAQQSEEEWPEAEAETPLGGDEGATAGFGPSALGAAEAPRARERRRSGRPLAAAADSAQEQPCSQEADGAADIDPAGEVAGGALASCCGAALPPEAPASADVLAFDICEEDIEPADHFFLQQPTLGTRALMMAVRREMVVLRKGLLEGSEGVPAPIVVRTFSSRSDLFRAMVVGPPETPYAHVPFFFDFALPTEYPREPPLAHFHAQHVGNERLNPNLYVDGKVCLSLLGTWSGPAWDPQRSTLLQVLVSLQGLVLVEEPYYNEPGHECDAGTEQGKQSSALYNEHARLLALRAALNVAQNPPCGFREIVSSFFARYGPKLVEESEEALQGPQAAQSSEGFRKVLGKTILPRLRERWGSASTAAAAAGAASSAGAAGAASSAAAAPAAAGTATGSAAAAAGPGAAAAAAPDSSCP